jgi:hypothetical protein
MPFISSNAFNTPPKPASASATIGVIDLIGAQQRVVDAAHDRRHRIRGIQRLVRIHLARQVRVARDLPARQIDGIQAGFYLLHGLVTRQSTQRVDVGLLVHELPQLLRAEPRQRILDVNRAAQAYHVFRLVRALHALPAGIGLPVFAQLLGSGSRHGSFLTVE